MLNIVPVGHLTSCKAPSMGWMCCGREKTRFCLNGVDSKYWVSAITHDDFLKKKKVSKDWISCRVEIEGRVQQIWLKRSSCKRRWGTDEITPFLPFTRRLREQIHLLNSPKGVPQSKNLSFHTYGGLRIAPLKGSIISFKCNCEVTLCMGLDGEILVGKCFLTPRHSLLLNSINKLQGIPGIALTLAAEYVRDKGFITVQPRYHCNLEDALYFHKIPMTIEQVLGYLKQLLAAGAALADLGVHGNLSLDNILLNASKNEVGISNLHSFRFYEEFTEPFRNKDNTQIRSFSYENFSILPPELATATKRWLTKPTEKTDVWAIGLIACELISYVNQKNVFPEWDFNKYKPFESEIGIRDQINAISDDEKIKSFLHEMLSFLPNRRPTFRELLKDLEADFPDLPPFKNGYQPLPLDPLGRNKPLIPKPDMPFNVMRKFFQEYEKAGGYDLLAGERAADCLAEDDGIGLFNFRQEHLTDACDEVGQAESTLSIAASQSDSPIPNELLT